MKTILKYGAILLMPWIIAAAVAGALFATGVLDRQKAAGIVAILQGRPVGEAAEPELTRDEIERAKADIEQRMQALHQREANFGQIEAVLNRREAGIHGLETELAARQRQLEGAIDDFNTRRAAWNAQVAAAEAAVRDADFVNAVQSFERMPPKSAARMLYDLDDGMVLRFLRAMRAMTRSDILAQIERIDADKNQRDQPAGPEDPRQRNRAARLQALLSGEEMG